jgi:hypothetical protein
MPDAPPAPPGPVPPAVLRIAVAGSRVLGPDAEVVATALQRLWNAVAGALAVGGVRLVLHSALANGVDRVAAATLLDTRVEGVACQHVAVLPFALEAYRGSGTIDEPAAFESLLARSMAVLEADGRWLPPVPDDPARDEFARHVRGRGYRAQARLMLQRCDVLVAVFDPGANGRAGGTAETVRAALDIGMPVLVCDRRSVAARVGWRLLQSVADLEGWQSWPDAVPACDLQSTDFVDHLQSWVRQGQLPEPKPGWHWLQTVWTWFERRYEPAAQQASPSPPEAPGDVLGELRRWASQTNRALSRSYRGGFVATFGLAASAATLAAASLGVIAIAAMLSPDAAPPWVKAVLLLAAVGKLAMIGLILGIVTRSESQQWNRDALASRFLAEHLRALLWLPALGLLRKPSARGHHHADETKDFRLVAERLAAALRAAPPWTGLQPHPGTQPPRYRVDPVSAIKSLRDQWLKGQRDYHIRNGQKMAEMARRLKHGAERLSQAVIAVVVLDAVLIGLALCGVVWASSATAGVLKVVLVLMAASLPAWVAALNGLREQAEAQRLAARSHQLAEDLKKLGGRCDALVARIENLHGKADEPGAWTLEALSLAEQCSLLVAEDVAEWGVLYGKDLLET